MARNLQKLQKLIVVGHGAAGLAAALSAAEQARSRDWSVEITLLEKSREGEAGGNTRWSPSYMRLDAPDRIDPGFEQDMQHASDGLADRSYFRILAENAVATVGWLQTHGVEFVTPVYYLSAGPARIQPVGGGNAIVEKLAAAAQRAGVKICYETALNGLVMTEGHRVRGVETQSSDGVAEIAGKNHVVRKHDFIFLPPGVEHAISNSGLVDLRSQRSAPVVLVYPYGIVVDQDGRRFFDEGSGLVHETWEVFARDIHFSRAGSIAYAVLDSRLFDIEGFGRAIRSEVPPYWAETLEDLAPRIGIPAGALRETVDAYNAAATGDVTRFDATRCDGLKTAGTLKPPKSNWARPITKPPFLAYPLVGAIAYTFGGLATNEKAEVLGERGPMPGLYAAGETTGHFYGTAPNAVSVLRALVFGKIAGREAIEFIRTRADQD